MPSKRKAALPVGKTAYLHRSCMGFSQTNHRSDGVRAKHVAMAPWGHGSRCWADGNSQGTCGGARGSVDAKHDQVCALATTSPQSKKDCWSRGQKRQLASAIWLGGVSAVMGASDLDAVTFQWPAGFGHQCSCSLPQEQKPRRLGMAC